MTLYLDSNTQQFVSSALFPVPLTSVSFMRGENARVNIVFVTDNVEIEADEDRQITFGIKAAGKYDADFLVTASDFTVSGTKYILEPSFNTATLNDLLNSGDDDGTNDVASITAMLQVSWSDDEGETVFKSNVLAAVINNDVIKGDEGLTTELPTLLDWLAIYRPVPLALISAPISGTADVLVTNSGLSYTNRRFYNDYSINGKRGYTATDDRFIEWQVSGTPKWVLRLDATTYFSSTQNVATPDLVTAWTTVSGTGSLTVTADPAGTAAKLDQNAIVNETDVYKCIRETPVKWVQIS
jgi:hypothetical protein